MSEQRLKEMWSDDSGVWDEDRFDEVVSVPEDLQAVDMHEAFQFGVHFEYGDGYVICADERGIVRIDF